MKYVIVPICKIVGILVILIASPLRIIWNLFFNFKIISLEESISNDGEVILDNFFSKETIDYIFSKQATDEFLND